jgi:hypothetical protein
MLKHLFVTIFLLASPLWARNTAGVADGSDWKQYSQNYKIGWIDGWATAMSDAQMGTAVLCAFQLHLTAESEEGKACTNHAQSLNYEMIKYAQYLEGMDAFYKDFRNTEVPINMAIKLVRDQIRGRPAEDIEKELVSVTSPSLNMSRYKRGRAFKSSTVARRVLSIDCLSHILKRGDETWGRDVFQTWRQTGRFPVCCMSSLPSSGSAVSDNSTL